MTRPLPCDRTGFAKCDLRHTHVRHTSLFEYAELVSYKLSQEVLL